MGVIDRLAEHARGVQILVSDLSPIAVNGDPPDRQPHKSRSLTTGQSIVDEPHQLAARSVPQQQAIAQIHARRLQPQRSRAVRLSAAPPSARLNHPSVSRETPGSRATPTTPPAFRAKRRNGTSRRRTPHRSRIPSFATRRHDYPGEEWTAKRVAFIVCRSLGGDTHANSIPFLESAPDDTLTQAAGLIDCLARRIETAAIPPAPAGPEADDTAPPATSDAAATADHWLPRRELATYQCSGGTRTIYGQRVDGTVRLTDVGPGRSYLIESGIDTNASLTALLADYLQQADQLAGCPMANSVLGDYLHQLVRICPT